MKHAAKKYIDIGKLCFSSQQASVVTVNVVPSSLILFTLTMEVIRSFETLVLTRTTRHHIQEDCILRSHSRENLKSYNRAKMLRNK
jgi:hypothetical protein